MWSFPDTSISSKKSSLFPFLWGSSANSSHTKKKRVIHFIYHVLCHKFSMPYTLVKIVGWKMDLLKMHDLPWTWGHSNQLSQSYQRGEKHPLRTNVTLEKPTLCCYVQNLLLKTGNFPASRDSFRAFWSFLTPFPKHRNIQTAARPAWHQTNGRHRDDGLPWIFALGTSQPGNQESGDDFPTRFWDVTLKFRNGKSWDFNYQQLKWCC